MGNPVGMVDPDGRSSEWIDNGDGTYTAEEGDSAFSLAKDAGISNSYANYLVESQLGPNYVGTDGGLKSNVEVGDKVSVYSYTWDIGWGAQQITELPNGFLPRGTSSTPSGKEEKINLLPGIGLSADAIGGFGQGLGKQGGSIRFTDGAYNGNNLSLRFYKSGWGGGSIARIKTYKGSAIGRLGTLATVGVGIYDIGTSISKEGGYGPESQRATGRAVGSLGGGYFGAWLGAEIGVWFGGVGAIPGGIIGGVVGSWLGAEGGEKVVEEFQGQ